MASVLRTLRHRKSPSELPSFDCIELADSIGSDDSQSSLEEEEMMSNARIPETFPMYRNTYQRRVQARRSFLMKICVAVFVVTTLILGYANLPTSQRSPHKHHTSTHGDSSRAARVARRLTLEAEQVHSLKNLVDERKIQEVSYKNVEELFGPGPHLVEFQIQIWGEDNKPEQLFFTVEMAPTRLMPTSVYYFLQQVEKGLWSETSIHLNTDHVIASQPAHGNGVSVMDRFNDSGVGSVPFIEYSNAYPHAPYTLGFIGTGPGFLINKKWNSHHDACFANVVVGRKTIDRIAALRGTDEDPARIRPVDIISARRVMLPNLNEQARTEYAALSVR